MFKTATGLTVSPFPEQRQMPSATHLSIYVTLTAEPESSTLLRAKPQLGTILSQFLSSPALTYYYSVSLPSPVVRFPSGVALNASPCLLQTQPIVDS